MAGLYVDIMNAYMFHVLQLLTHNSLREKSVLTLLCLKYTFFLHFACLNFAKSKPKQTKAMHIMLMHKLYSYSNNDNMALIATEIQTNTTLICT